MLNLKSMTRRTETPAPPAPPAGMIQIPLSETMRTAIAQIATKWGLTTEETSRRIMVMSLSGWKLKYAGFLTNLSAFCADDTDAFQSTCITVRNWLNLHERGMEEDFSDSDVTTRLEFVLDTLREKRAAGEKADLNKILEEDAQDDWAS